MPRFKHVENVAFDVTQHKDKLYENGIIQVIEYAGAYASDDYDALYNQINALIEKGAETIINNYVVTLVSLQRINETKTHAMVARTFLIAPKKGIT